MPRRSPGPLAVQTVRLDDSSASRARRARAYVSAKGECYVCGGHLVPTPDAPGSRRCDGCGRVTGGPPAPTYDGRCMWCRLPNDEACCQTRCGACRNYAAVRDGTKLRRNVRRRNDQ